MIDPLDPGTFELSLPAHPLSNTERQRKLRQERNKAGIKPVYVSPAERELIGKALRLFGRVSFSPERASGDVARLLGRVVPDGPQGRELDDSSLLEVGDVGQLAFELGNLRQEREHFEAQLADCRRHSYDREQALKRELAETEAWGEHYRRQRDGKQSEIENLLGVLRELQALAEELGGPAMSMVRAPETDPQQATGGVLDLAQLNEDELNLLKGALSEHHEKNKAVLWKDVACENLWRRLSLLQVDLMEPKSDPFAMWEGDPVWSKSALQVATAEARQGLAEGPDRPIPTDCDRRSLAAYCNNKNVKTVRLRSQVAGNGKRNEFLGDVVRMCGECRKANNGGFKIVTAG